ncbi:lysozyme inhibitor LprI family protein [Methylomonas fluvii]|uniref:DUF1311 domain-containing protein n=1 Tax=Methylomonas fluvii TaxID=1854564 RepID=A0ABR9DIB7_9GAMM|nr:lysozyme inhibitor LprI family protein [Methylomonas fluvii]MBD9362850.1 DUF1311 domain-containing protein [Methylomonas fluvii]
MFKIGILLVSMVLSFTVAAGEAKLSSQYSACMDKSEGVTVSMLDCIADETKLQDDRLNKAYKSALKSIDPARVKALQDAQRAWVKFRDSNCGFYANPDGGTAATISANDCVMSSTAERAQEIESLMPDSAPPRP